MESALDVLSRAATMVQDNVNETRLISKELPTAAWRRERRLRAAEYHHPSAVQLTSSERILSPDSSPPPNAHDQNSISCSGSTKTKVLSNAHQLSIMIATNVRSLKESENRTTSLPFHSNIGQMSRSQSLQHINSNQNNDAPLDMSVGNLKQRNSPPPPYREPLPGSQFASSLVRPSVITQAPPKKDARDILLKNRENENHSCESIDEHFRRSLGNDYFALFSKKSTSHSATTSAAQQNIRQISAADVRNSSPTLSSILPQQSSLTQLELIPPPAYPMSLSSNNYQQNSHQNQKIDICKANNIILSPATIAGKKKILGPDSPPLPLTVKKNHQHNLVLHKSSSSIDILTASKPTLATSRVKLVGTAQASTFSTPDSRNASPLLLQHQPTSVPVNLSHLSVIDNSRSSSPGQTSPVPNMSTPNPSPNLPIATRIKTEPGLQTPKTNSPTPPDSPILTINHNVNSNSSMSSNRCSPLSSKSLRWKSTNINKTNSEVLASVDDHFAKALGDTWKKLQKNNDIHK